MIRARKTKTGDLLPPPRDLGLPFDQWRPGQERTLLKMAGADRRFIGLSAPTGTGKTLLGQAWAALCGWKRMAALTATRGLQDQQAHDMPLVDVRGMANYPCVVLMDKAGIPKIKGGGGKYTHEPWSYRCDRGPCRGGEKCELAFGGCAYFDQVRAACAAGRVGTNYSYFLAMHLYSTGLGEFDGLVADEAHSIPEELERAFTIEISEEETHSWRLSPTPRRPDIIFWREWAEANIALLPPDKDASPEDVRRLRMLRGKVERLKALRGKWIAQEGRAGVWAVIPVWPGKEFAGALWRESARVVLSSATLTPKALDLLGLKPEEVEWVECESPFPIGNRLVTWVPTTRVDSRTDFARPWIRRIDQIINGRLDRKGIVHTVSYDRADLLIRSSAFAHIMFANRSARETKDVVARFKAAPAPAVLVSPSVVSGYDFIGDLAEYQVIGKIPFPDSRSGIMKARTEDDKEYPYYLAAQDLVQSAGRINRQAADVGETIIVDDHWAWFKKRASAFFPRFFRQAMRVSDTLPHPPARK